MQLRFLLIFPFMLWWCGPAQAFSCSFSNTGINFGNVDLSKGGGFEGSSGTFSADCTGNPGQVIRICANFNQGSGGAASSGSPRYLTQGVSKLGYDLFRGNGAGQVWGSYTWSSSARPPDISVTIGSNGFGSASYTINARLYHDNKAALPTGTYLSTFSGSQSMTDYGLQSSFNCSSTLSPRAVSVPFVVRTTQLSTCIVAATNMDFGLRLQLDSAVNASNLITATCTAGTQFEIGLSDGAAGGAMLTSRRMAGTVLPSQTVQYQIYKNAARTQVWGSTIGGNTMSSTATGLPQAFTGYGLVPAQPTPSSQLYTDNLVVTITY